MEKNYVWMGRQATAAIEMYIRHSDGARDD